MQWRLQGEVDATWAQGEENYTLKGEEFPQIYGSYVIYKSFFLHGSVCLCLAAVLKQKMVRMHQILFQFPFSGVTPRPPGGEEGEGKGRKREGRGGNGEGGGREGRGKFASLPLGIDAPGSMNIRPKPLKLSCTVEQRE